MKKLLNSSGIIQITCININLETQTTDTSSIYCGCTCVNINNKKIIACNYIPGIISACFYSHRELTELFNNSDIDWTTAHNISIDSISKQWDYTQFVMMNEEQTTFINFPQINTIMDSFSVNNNYNFFGISNNKINFVVSTKINLIHDKIQTKQLWHLVESIESYCGTIIYRTYRDENNKLKFKVLGYTSSNYDVNTRIVPLEYLLNKDIYHNIFATIMYLFYKCYYFYKV